MSWGSSTASVISVSCSVQVRPEQLWLPVHTVRDVKLGVRDGGNRDVYVYWHQTQVLVCKLD